VQVSGLYMMMGRGLEALSEVPAGCVAAIGGLGAAVLKSATLASSPACRPLAPMLFQARPAASESGFPGSVQICPVVPVLVLLVLAMRHHQA
jgi:translation elongation factor EF-G